MGKRFVHAVDYGMEADTASEQLLKMGLSCRQRGVRNISRVLGEIPSDSAVAEGHQSGAAEDRRLENSWGGSLM